VSIPYEPAVIEDLAVGYGSKTVTMPAGGEAIGKRINRGNLPEPSGRCGTVHVYPPQSMDGKGIVYASDGTEVDTDGSTTSGLQEAIDYAQAHHMDLHIHGGDEGPQASVPGSTSGNAVHYQCSETLTIGPCQGKRITTGSVFINFTMTDASPGLLIDSCMNTVLRFHGLLVKPQGTGPTVRFAGSSLHPYDGYAFGTRGLVASHFYLHSVVANDAALSAVEFQGPVSGGSINACMFEFDEINMAKQAVLVTTPVSGASFVDNVIRVNNIYNQLDVAYAVIQVGTSAGTRIQRNQWACSMAVKAAKTGINTYAQFDVYLPSISPAAGHSNPTYSLYFNSGGDNNLILARYLVGPLGAHASAGKFSKVLTAGGTTVAQITPTGSLFIYQNADYVPETVIVQGGTVSKVEISQNASAWTDTGVTAGAFHLEPGWGLRVTYSAAPTMAKLLPLIS
jgi:hypothetical protein